MARKQDAVQPGKLTAQDTDQGQTVHLRHQDIGYEQIDLLLPDDAQRLLAIAGPQYLIHAELLPGDGIAQRVQDTFFIVSQEDSIHTLT